MANELTITLSKFEPPDPDQWRRSTTAQRKGWFQLVGKHALQVLRRRLLAGRDRFGKKFLRRLEPRADGADGPALSPHAAASRSVRLMESRSSAKDAIIYWKDGWGEILAYHQAGIPSRRGPRVRDVAGFTDKERVEIYNAALGEWKGPAGERASSSKRDKAKAQAAGRAGERIVEPRARRVPGTGAKVSQVREGEGPDRFGSFFGGKTQAQSQNQSPAGARPDLAPAPVKVKLGTRPKGGSAAVAVPVVPPPAPGPDVAASASAPAPAKTAKPKVDPYANLRPEIAQAKREIDDALKAQAKASAKFAKTATDFNWTGAQYEIPNLLPPGPIKDRLEAYKPVGDLKRKAIIEASELPDPEVQSREAAILTHRANADAVMAQVQMLSPDNPERAALIDQIKDLNAKGVQMRKDLFDEKKKADARRRENVFKLLEVDPKKSQLFGASDHAGPIFNHPGVAPRPLSGRPDVAARVDESLAFLSKITRRTELGTAVERPIAVGANVRDYHTAQHILLDEVTPNGVIVHEFGHAIERDTYTAGQPLWKRTHEFLEHRCGNEQPQKFKDLFPNFKFRDDEMGRKDQFDKVFPTGASSWYVGKSCVENSEVISMGLEALYNDPVRFAKVDPEYFDFITSVLDGSIR